jgi:SAM-dependent methyltransferase
MKILVARDYREAYAYRARYFADASLMAGRDSRSTRLKARNVVAMLPVTSRSRVLDVGCGDGAVLALLRGHVAVRCGVDPCAEAVARLRRRFRSEPDVAIEVGAAERLAFADAAFDVVVSNAVLLHLDSEDAIVRGLAELARVCRHGGIVFIGEMPFVSEAGWTRWGRLLRHFGVAGVSRFVVESYLAPLARGEPLLIEPSGRTLWVPIERMLTLCERLGPTRHWRHREVRGPSTTRSDYLIVVDKRRV